MKRDKGITLIALVVTIIVLLILAGISISMLTGQNGILRRASEAKIKTEISGIEEKLNIKEMTEDKIIFGKIDECLDLNSTYNDKLYIENGKIVYDINKVSSEEENILQQMNLKTKTNHYIIVSNNKKADYEENENVGTITDFSKKVNDGTFNYEKVYLSEDVSIESDDWIAIGTNTNKFSSEFEGNNKTIYIKVENESNDGGIFEYNAGKISNLKVDGEIKLKTVGGIAKINEGTIENCINGAYIYMVGGNSGGIVGKNDGKVINCTNIGNSKSLGVTIGGIVGWNRGEIISCNNRGTLENIKKIDAANLGGICGANEGEISKCFNTGEVKATVNDLGGISGINYSKIKNCYNTGNIIGDVYATGGIVGFGVKGQKIIKCYNIGKVTGKVAVGGIIGSCRVGELEDNQWYSEGLEYGIGDAKSNEGATLNKSLILNDLKEIVK